MSESTLVQPVTLLMQLDSHVGSGVLVWLYNVQWLKQLQYFCVCGVAVGVCNDLEQISNRLSSASSQSSEGCLKIMLPTCGAPALYSSNGKLRSVKHCLSGHLHWSPSWLPCHPWCNRSYSPPAQGFCCHWPIVLWRSTCLGIRCASNCLTCWQSRGQTCVSVIP